MGIPAFFGKLVSNHPEIVQTIDHVTQYGFRKKVIKHNISRPDNFYLDANSIIYDTAYALQKDFPYSKSNDHIFTDLLCDAICKKIELYNTVLSPTQLLFIALDGVAPRAKLEQQRTRRYKGWFIKQFLSKFKQSNEEWNTTSITPGTVFMDKLHFKLMSYFNDAYKFGVNNIIVSSATESGEGEHKIFDFIRTIANKDCSSVIYGLDADLIVLSLAHTNFCNGIYLFRETPHFIKQINSNLLPNELYLLNIDLLRSTVCRDMTYKLNINESEEYRLILDYVLLTFFMGNDYMPHLPSFNLRSNALEKVIKAYKKLGPNSYLIDLISEKEMKIKWSNLRNLFKELALIESELLQDEHEKRDKLENKMNKFDNIKTNYQQFLYDKSFLLPEEVDSKIDISIIEKDIDNIPIKNRNAEKFINPSEPDWKNRYYHVLFNLSSPAIDLHIKEINIYCKKYLEALEWTLAYYMTGCKDWNWYYPFTYGPLMCDLVDATPILDTEFIQYNMSSPLRPLVQLAYVLPENALNLLPNYVKDKLLERLPECYGSTYKFNWHYCRYFWESHVDFPPINLNTINEIVTIYEKRNK